MGSEGGGGVYSHFVCFFIYILFLFLFCFGDYILPLLKLVFVLCCCRDLIAAEIFIN